MTDENSTTEQPATEEKSLYKVDDNVIGMVRELVQLSLLTGTNIVDHLRTLVLEVHSEDKRFLTLSPGFVESYNRMVAQLNAQAEAQMAENEKQLAAMEREAPTGLLDS